MAIDPTQLEIITAIHRIIQARTLATHFGDWYENAGKNIRHNVKHWITDLHLKPRGDSVFIVGPGASIHQYRDRLPEIRDHGLVVAQPTAYQWCRAIGLEPDVVVAADKSPTMAEMIKGFTGPVIAPITTDVSLGAFNPYYYTVYHGTGSPDDPNFGQVNRSMYHLTRGAYSPHGWVSLGDVTNAALQIFEDFLSGSSLQKIGAERIVLIGIDRCYFQGYGRLNPDGGDPLPHLPNPEEDITFRTRLTNTKMVFYAERMMTFWNMFPIPLYHLDHGIHIELPWVSVDHIVNHRYPKPLTPKQVKARAREFFEQYVATFPYELADKREFLSALKEEYGEQVLAGSGSAGPGGPGLLNDDGSDS